MQGYAGSDRPRLSVVIPSYRSEATIASCLDALAHQTFDDFEAIVVDSTILIDRAGRIHWARHGGAPFEDMDFLLKELARMESRKPWSSPELTAGR